MRDASYSVSSHFPSCGSKETRKISDEIANAALLTVLKKMDIRSVQAESRLKAAYL